MLRWFGLGRKAPDIPDRQKIVRAIQAYAQEACSGNSSYRQEIKPGESEHCRELLAASLELQVDYLYVVLESFAERWRAYRRDNRGTYNTNAYCQLGAHKILLAQMLRRNLPHDKQSLFNLLRLANDCWKVIEGYRPQNALFGLIEKHYAGKALPNDIAKEIRRTIAKAKRTAFNTADDRKLITRGGKLIGTSKPTHLEGRFSWVAEVDRSLKSLSELDRPAWINMFEHARTADAASPGKKWLTTARACTEEIGEQQYAELLIEWLQHLRKEKAEKLPLKHENNATLLRGLIWAASLISPRLVAAEIKQTALYCFAKVKDVGAVSPKVGNACLYVLGELSGLEAVTMLTELQKKIQYPSATRLVEKALDAAAKRNAISREDIMELSIPEFGLDDSGMLRREIGDTWAIVRIEPDRKVVLCWEKSCKKPQKSVPREIKEHHGEALKGLRRDVKELRSALQAQSARLEKLFLKPGAWDFEQWRQRYLRHPLVRNVAKDLIWQFEFDGGKRSAIFMEGALRDQRCQSIESVLASADGPVAVRLWHPVYDGVEQVKAWRRLIVDRGITQPFKQAHREVYLLTDAERRTEMYSNRFAAHILKQHQVKALCQQRDWSYTLQGSFDSWNAPTRILTQWDLAVEWYLDPVESSENARGIYNYISSDQVRFTRDSELLALEAIQPIIFSEVMRDVDLFVGVSSIGNDPSWRDRGVDGGFNDYWREYAFGELLDTAETRKEVLAGLLPRLRISEKCELAGRFLKVRGKYRTYKIHLGSGNILMEPNDQYLCIVEERSTKQADMRNLVLPFEGDHRMAVILSKAFLLADDCVFRPK